MKRVVLIHTVKSVYESFEGKLRAALGGLGEELKIHNMLDDFLAFDVLPSEKGRFTAPNKRRLLLDLMSAELTGADIIVTTCSQLSPTVKQFGFLIKAPIVTIDGAMIEKAVSISSKIGLLSTAFGTVPPMTEMIELEAKKQGKHIELQILCDNDAIMALRAGDMEKHDRLVRRLADAAVRCESIIMAQASAAHMRGAVAEIAGVPVFTGVDMCIEQIAELLMLNINPQVKRSGHAEQ